VQSKNYYDLPLVFHRLRVKKLEAVSETPSAYLSLFGATTIFIVLILLTDFFFIFICKILSANKQKGLVKKKTNVTRNLKL
jgi:hypothetical protein